MLNAAPVQDIPFIHRFVGVISADSAVELQGLVKSAADSKLVKLDFTQVTRLNSMGIALLLKALKELCQSGKTIQIHGANKMTQTLFRMMGIAKWATVLP